MESCICPEFFDVLSNLSDFETSLIVADAHVCQVILESKGLSHGIE